MGSEPLKSILMQRASTLVSHRIVGNENHASGKTENAESAAVLLTCREPDQRQTLESGCLPEEVGRWRGSGRDTE